MIKAYNGIPRFHKGDVFTDDMLQIYITNIYSRFNELVPDNLKTITTGQVIGNKQHNNLKYPNYCGMLDVSGVITSVKAGEKDYGLTDGLTQKLADKIDNILKEYEGK